jgi:hypothetical protein
MNKAELLELLQTKRAEYDAALAEVPPDQMTQPGAAGEWSIKDIIAHLTYHERWYADRLHEQLRGEVYVSTELDYMPFDERNHLIYLQQKDRPLAEILAESKVAFSKLIEGVKAHPESFLVEPQQLEGAPQPIVIWQMLRGDVYEHYGQHIPSIKNWAAKVKAN